MIKTWLLKRAFSFLHSLVNNETEELCGKIYKFKFKHIYLQQSYDVDDKIKLIEEIDKSYIEISEIQIKLSSFNQYEFMKSEKVNHVIEMSNKYLKYLKTQRKIIERF